YMPVYKGDGTTFDFCIPFIPKMNITIGKYLGAGMWMMQSGMLMYKLFAIAGLLMKGFKPDFKEVGYKKYTKTKMLKISDQLNPNNLVGGFRFTDCKIEDVERLVIENILSAKHYADKNGTQISAANYVEASLIERGKDGRISRVEVRDVIDGSTTSIKPKYVVNSTGIFIDDLKKKAGIGGPDLLRRVSGIHLIVPRFWKTSDSGAAFAFWIDKKILFAISKGDDRILIGTTERDIELRKNENHNRTFSDDVKEVIRKTAAKFPEFKFDTSRDIYYTRVRPLMFQPSKSDPKAVSRRDLIKWHPDAANMVSVSGKLGPARHLGELVGRKLFSLAHPSKPYSSTHKDCFPGGSFEGTLEDMIAKGISAHPNLPARMIETLVRRYGSRYELLLSVASGPGDLAPIRETPDSLPLCSLLFAYKYEHCRKLSDAFTRTGNVKQFGEGLDCVEKAARYLGEKLEWDEAGIEAEIKGYKDFVATRKELVGDIDS
ncbi:MAG TPA: FAD-dependent oxidoreductase, partial [bacterium]|nr:FAD-dependent oxidoreductase [bacterium]